MNPADRIRSEIARLGAMNEHGFFNTPISTDRLLKAMTVMVSALEHYESAHYDGRGYQCHSDDTATETLAEAAKLLCGEGKE